MISHKNDDQTWILNTSRQNDGRELNEEMGKMVEEIICSLQILVIHFERQCEMWRLNCCQYD